VTTMWSSACRLVPEARAVGGRKRNCRLGKEKIARRGRRPGGAGNGHRRRDGGKCDTQARLRNYDRTRRRDAGVVTTYLFGIARECHNVAGKHGAGTGDKRNRGRANRKAGPRSKCIAVPVPLTADEMPADSRISKPAKFQQRAPPQSLIGRGFIRPSQLRERPHFGACRGVDDHLQRGGGCAVVDQDFPRIRRVGHVGRKRRSASRAGRPRGEHAKAPKSISTRFASPRKGLGELVGQNGVVGCPVIVEGKTFLAVPPDRRPLGLGNRHRDVT